MPGSTLVKSHAPAHKYLSSWCGRKPEEMFVLKRSLWLVGIAGLVLATPRASRAQIIEGRVGQSGQPLAFASLSIGWFTQQGLCDQASSACWNFGSAPQWRATLEKGLGRGASFGVMGTLSRVPLVYQGSALTTNSCASCDANASVSQLMATLHIGGNGRGFSQVIDASGGVTLFSNFRDATNNGQLGTGKTVSDVSFIIGYGFGYGLSPNMSVSLVQDYGLVIGKRVSGQSSNSAQATTLRLGVRVGLGG